MTPERFEEIGRALVGRNDAVTMHELFVALCHERSTSYTLVNWIRVLSLNPEASDAALTYANSCGAAL